MHIALSTRALAPHQGQESGLTSLRGSLSFLCTPVRVVCRVLAVRLLAFGAEASERISAPVAHRPAFRVARLAPSAKDKASSLGRPSSPPSARTLPFTQGIFVSPLRIVTFRLPRELVLLAPVMMMKFGWYA